MPGLSSIVRAVLLRPHLWKVAVQQGLRLAPRGWWRRSPFLPLPDAEYLHFRLTTMYGGADPEPDPTDVVAWLEWCRRWPSIAA